MATRILNGSNVDVAYTEQFVVGRYYMGIRQNETAEMVYTEVPSIPCDQLYDLSNTDDPMLSKELDSTWMCPNVDAFNLAGDPYFYYGENFNYIVDYCAVRYPQNSSCIPVEGSASAIAEMRV